MVYQVVKAIYKLKYSIFSAKKKTPKLGKIVNTGKTQGI